MTTKQKKYRDSLKEKGLTKFQAIVPIREVERLREITDSMRKGHLKKGEG